MAIKGWAAVVGLVVSLGALLAAAPAGAVQTTTWGIMASPSGHGGRSLLDHPADGRTVQDAVIVYNRTDAPVEVDLSLLDSSFNKGAYQFFAPAGGLASRVKLATTAVRLGPLQQARVPVTIAMPAHLKASTLAAIAAESVPIHDGALLVQQRLILFIRATPVSSRAASVGTWGAIAAALVGLAVLLSTREIRRSRRSVRQMAHSAP